ncbi:TonB-dependent receptor [Ideonella sp.]|uniref:TonB-dependent receptor n=1 Tax=Ideonella sp. TaxID=1929293 RepID=UPI003BB55A41
MSQQAYRRATCLALTLCAMSVNRAWAQIAEPAPAAIASAADAPAAGHERIQLKEVIVTAQKRAQPASKTPVSLSVMGAEELKNLGAASASSLTDLTPAVQIGLNNGAMNVNIRGVTSNDNTEKGDPSAAFNLDGIYMARPQGAGLAFFDLERVEILRGPQGTLYGRNSTAGAVNVITAKPTDRFAASARIDLGNYSSRAVEGMINVPLSDAFSIRAALATADHKGYIETTNATTGQAIDRGRDDQKDVSARLHALAKFSADTSLLLTVDGSSLKGNGVGSVDVAAYLADRKTRSTATAITGSRDNRSSGAAAEFKTNLSFAEFTYLYGHRNFKIDVDSSLGAGSATSESKADFGQNSHELRLGSARGSELQWVGGLYFFKEESKSDFDVFGAAPVGDGTLRFHMDPTISESKAAFGQATYALLSDLRLTGGLRYTKDSKSRVGFNQSFGFPSSPNDASVDYSQANWKLGVDYDLDKATMLFANVSTGYKAGGFNDGTIATNPDLYYDPEHLTAFEAGVKGRFLDQRLRLSLSGFGYNYTDLQVSSVGSDNTLQTRNAAKARIFGGEAEGKYSLTESSTLNFGLSLLNAKYKAYAPLTGVDWSGRALDKSPKATLALGYTHDWFMEDGATLSGYLGARYSGAYVVSDFSTAQQYKQPSYTKSDLHLTYSASGEKWFVQLYGKNLEDANVISGYNFNTFTLSEPRTFGVRAGFKL